MTVLPMEMFYWQTNPDWFTINKEKDCFELTEDAPERAVRSFDMYCHPEKYGIYNAR